MSATMVGRRRKILKSYCLKCPKIVPKIWNLDQKINYSKPNIFGVYFLISGFLAQSIKANKEQNNSLILQTSTNSTLQKLYSRNTAKNFTHFTNFPAYMFVIGVRKNICTAPLLDTKKAEFWKRLESKCLYIPLQLSQNVGCIYRVRVWKSSLRRFAVSASYNVLQLFFSIQILPSLALKRSNFSYSLDLMGKVVAKLAGFYKIRVFTEKCFRADYNFNSNYILCNGGALK